MNLQAGGKIATYLLWNGGASAVSATKTLYGAYTAIASGKSFATAATPEVTEALWSLLDLLAGYAKTQANRDTLDAFIASLPAA